MQQQVISRNNAPCSGGITTKSNNDLEEVNFDNNCIHFEGENGQPPLTAKIDQSQILMLSSPDLDSKSIFGCKTPQEESVPQQ